MFMFNLACLDCYQFHKILDAKLLSCNKQMTVNSITRIGGDEQNASKERRFHTQRFSQN